MIKINNQIIYPSTTTVKITPPITNIATVIVLWDRYDRNIRYSCTIFGFRIGKREKGQKKGKNTM